MQKEDALFPCPASQALIQKQVIIDHPDVLPLTYDSISVYNAAAAGELLPFGINSDNLINSIFVDYFSNDVLERIRAGKITLAPQVFTENRVEKNSANNEDDFIDLEYPITPNFVTDIGALCRRDGRLYDFQTLKSVL